MKVYLKFPWKFIDSPYYVNLIKYPPHGVDFYGIPKQKTNVIIVPEIFTIRNVVKKFLRCVLEHIKLPNITFTFSNADLIHCGHCLLLNKKPWVVDAEHYWSFSSSAKISYSETGRTFIEKILKRKYCKKVLPWSYAAENTIKAVMKNRHVLNKIEVVYPAVPVPKIRQKKSEPISLLFIGRYFYQKGGLFALETFKRLRQKYDVKCTAISLTIPQHLKLKYEKFVKIYNSVSDRILFHKIYPSSSIFVYPGFSDTFGFSLLEAMSFGNPIITVDAFARKEIVEDGRNGFILQKPKNLNIYDINTQGEKLISAMVKKTALLIENSSLRKKMGREGRRLVEKGKFSLKERNKKLKNIYEEATSF